MADPYQQLEAELEKLRQSYRASLPEKVADLEAAWLRFLSSSTQTGVLEDFHLKAHSLAGSGATYGLPALSTAARRLELALKELLQAGPHSFEPKKAAIQELFEALKAVALDQTVPLPSTATPSPPATSVEPGALTSTGSLDLQDTPLETILNTQVENRLIWLIEDDRDLDESLSRQLGYFGYEVLCFSRSNRITEDAYKRLPAALICDLNHSRTQLNSPLEHAEIEQFKQTGLPLIFISTYTNLENRLEAVRLGGKAYLTKPLKTRELIDILDKLTTSQIPAPYQVLILSLIHI